MSAKENADGEHDAQQVAVRRQQCIEIAKRNAIDLLWRTANIEVAVTFPQTEQIFDGIAPEGADGRAIRVVNNLKHAWRFLFDNADWPVDWPYVSEYNRLIDDGLELSPGTLRTIPVGISGTAWIPPVLSADGVHAQIAACNAAADPFDRAAALFGAVNRGQWFLNGNKRTAVMAANHSLIHDGAGVLALPADRMGREFRDILLRYYETGDIAPLAEWLRTTSFHAL